jgi:hypothetical protein
MDGWVGVLMDCSGDSTLMDVECRWKRLKTLYLYGKKQTIFIKQFCDNSHLF